MCSIGRTTHVPSPLVNASIDNTHSSSPIMSNDIETNIESSTSTPELNLLLDKLTEILRFRSGCRRHLGVIQQEKDVSPSSPTTNLKRLRSSSIEPLHNTIDISSMSLNNSLISTGAWKSTNMHNKSSMSNRFQHHHHHKYHVGLSNNINNFEKKRRLPCLLQRLIDEGNLIKEAVSRLKTQRFSQTLKLQEKQNLLYNPSTPKTTKKSSIQSQTNFMTRLTPSSSINITIPQPLNDSPIQTTSSPNRSISWFLSSNVFGVNASTTNHSSESGSPLRTYYSSSTHDRTPMEISIHDV
ncbi:unnamed protein product [Rotaria magnacalcarata]|uniref:Uncharacterized protein n=5 Tax=Rotaria magnacalcarata TaxID=392030 RepID=A0A815X8H5_9BILA|nr:unnamed protein product [Rotaria magnacalcarata]CAF1652652.1 unnamed protein product [Rotaria magnacalcarata]CAF2010451.1 unnamed protein product [Rotaria magnacalcarata]CAF2126938.1 unnamed protein product [Rotaria magnacalcarata]CAF2239236.1 unnamed protein product [Rotaria magnacalcarata]